MTNDHWLVFMRVISGIAKGRKLYPFKGLHIRPTSDRARESLFNILGDKVARSSFLDLFAGSGAVGIEALSRNAEKVVFVENHPESIALIKKNIEKCGFLNRNIEIIQKDAIVYLKSTRKLFDVIFIDPPYGADVTEKLLSCLSKKELLKPDGMMIFEQYYKNAIRRDISGLEFTKKRRVGDTLFTFFLSH